MANDVTQYQIDISKLNNQVKQLTDRTQELRSEQERLNQDFKEGKITEKEYTKSSEELSKQLAKAKGDMLGLLNAIKGVNKETKDTSSMMSRTLGQAFGAMQSALSGVLSSFDNYRQKMKEAQEAAEDEQQAKALEKIKQQYEKLFETEDEQVKQLEKFMKRTEAEGQSSYELEQAKQKEIEKQVTSTKELIAQKEKELAVAKEQAKASQTRWKGGSADKQHRQDVFSVTTIETELNMAKDRYKTITKIQDTYLEDLHLKELSRIKKEDDEKTANEKKLKEKKEADAKKYYEEQKKLREDTEKAIDTLSIELISDEEKREKAKIENTRKWSLIAIDKVYKTASENNKKLLDEQKKLINQTSDYAIKMIKDKKLTESFKATVADMESKQILRVKKYFMERNGGVFIKDEDIAIKIKEGYDKLLADTNEYINYLSSAINLKDAGKAQVKFDFDLDLEAHKAEKTRDYIIDAMNEVDSLIEKEELEIWKIEIAEKEALSEIEEVTNNKKNLITKQYESEIERLKLIRDKIGEEDYLKSEYEAKNSYDIEMFNADKDMEVSKYNLYANYENKRLLIHKQTDEQIEAIDRQTAQTTLNLWSTSLSGVGSLLGALADNAKENSKEQINLQIASCYANMAAALATGIANAAEAGWPAMLAVIPATVAELLATFNTVNKIKEQAKYAEGGLVLGAGSGTSDSINAKLSNGESVINAKATSMYAPLLDAINRSTGGAPIQTANNNNAFVAQLATAMSAQPAPIVSVKSINAQSTRYDKITSLRSL